MVTKIVRSWVLLLHSLLLLTACSGSLFSQPQPIPEPVSTHISAPPVKQVALLLPVTGNLGNAGKAIQAGFNDNYANANPGLINKPVIKIYNTAQDVSIRSLYQQAITNGANYIVGPLDKDKVTSLLGDNIAHNPTYNNIIILALNNANTDKVQSNFYQFSLSPRGEAAQLADKAAKQGYHRALMITPAGSWGKNIADALQAQWQKNGGVIVDSLEVDTDDNLAKNIQGLLAQKDNSDVIFLIARPLLAREIKPLLQYYHAGNLPVYSTSLIYTGLMNSPADQDLNGIIFCDEPLVLDPTGSWAAIRQQLTIAQPVSIQQYIRLYGLGWDAALLTQNFNALNQGVNGATGRLTLATGQHIVRQLTWATFQNGMATTLNN